MAATSVESITLLQGAATSDQPLPSEGAKSIKIVIETLVPMRQTAVDSTPEQTAGSLTTRFVEALQRSRRSTVHPNSTGVSAVRLVHDGVYLDERRPLRELGLDHDSVVIAVARHVLPAHALPAAVELLLQWWPVVCTSCLVLVVLISAACETADCTRPLWGVVCVGAPMLIPFALVLSGALQEASGYRLLWFLRHRLLVWLVPTNAVAALIWLGAGADDIFGAGDECDEAASLLAAASMFVWVALLSMSLLWMLLAVAPCLAMCRLELGFRVLGFMAGSHRHPAGCAAHFGLDRSPSVGA